MSDFRRSRGLDEPFRGGFFRGPALFFSRFLPPSDDGPPDPLLFDLFCPALAELLSNLGYGGVGQSTHVVLDLNPQLQNAINQVLIVHVEFFRKLVHPHSRHEYFPLIIQMTSLRNLIYEATPSAFLSGPVQGRRDKCEMLSTSRNAVATSPEGRKGWGTRRGSVAGLLSHPIQAPAGRGK